MPKPWLTSKSVVEVKARVTLNPFQWPRKTSLDDFRAMIRRGNHSPSPGPDRCEKWTIKALSDSALSLVLDLHNYEVAAQPGVQTRDLMSYLSAIKCWAHRHKQPIYAIKRDQMKGFDYLSPDGFYDAVNAYGLPSEIIDLDRAAQHEVKCYIQTAYGATDPITVSGVSKQGGPASLLKSTYTTSMGHYYLRDILENDSDALRITTTSNKRNDPHTTDASLELMVAMVEATDDSYIFSKTAELLRQHTLTMERFQYAYGWLTNWIKSNAYVLAPNPAVTYPLTLTFDSVTVGPRENPLTITNRTITLIKDDMDFLRTKVDNPGERFIEMKNIIDTFQFPTVIGRLPITVLQKIVAQNVVSKCRALLSLQPISKTDATTLDKMIIKKVHDALGFPFLPSTDIALMPISEHGFAFPSITNINASLAVEGLNRDLNHHIPAYRNMALITLADWTCDKSGCRNPLEDGGLTKDFAKQMKQIPASWITAQKTMKVNRTTLLSLKRMGIKHLRDIGKWKITDEGRI
ncbi:hypothetical protein BJ165DRAFT_1360880, partial [Panaeolus papilionaceus]